MRDKEFRQGRIARTAAMANDQAFSVKSQEWLSASVEHQYSYNFDWLGLPAIQYPQDTVFLQELIWSAKPDLIIETGVARGGSLMLSASLMVLLELERKKSIDLSSRGLLARVVGVEIELSDENRELISNHMLSPYIALVDGSSTDSKSVKQVHRIISETSSKNPIVILDSNHSHDHVLAELNLYSQFLALGGFIVVMDTVIEDLDPRFHDPARWGKGNNPMSAVEEFLRQTSNFVVDETLTEKLMVSVAPKGVLRRAS